MIDRARSFGSVAAAYERFRPDYPPEVVDVVLDFTGQPVVVALEIGAGTGKATRLFAQRGIAVTASEPDAEMLAELRAQVPDSVEPVQASFEELALDRTYDLVYAAAAMHWTDPDGRWRRVAALLEPGGVFACFGNPIQLADPDLEAAMFAAQEPFLTVGDLVAPNLPTAGGGLQWPGSELAESDWFTDVQETVLTRRFPMLASDFIGQLSTVSAYVVLPPADRDQVWQRIRQVPTGPG